MSWDWEVHLGKNKASRSMPSLTSDLLLYVIAAWRKLIIEKYNSMDEILRECNSMAGKIDVWSHMTWLLTSLIKNLICSPVVLAVEQTRPRRILGVSSLLAERVLLSVPTNPLVGIENVVI
jgi:hypothetical protein